MSRRPGRSLQTTAKSSLLIALVRATIWFASLASLGELAYWRWFQSLWHHKPESQYPWWIPLGNLLVFIPLLTLATMAARLRSRSHDRAMVFAAGCTAVLFGWLSLIRSLGDLAAAILAVGIGFQAFRLAVQRRSSIDRVVRVSLPFVAIPTFVIAATTFLHPILREQRSLASLPSGTARPDVILIVLDTVRARSLEAYGYAHGRTPNLDRLAARGVIFEHAIASAPWTLPSHGTLFTGRWPHELSTRFEGGLDGTYPTLAEVLAHGGYATAAFMGNNVYGGSEFGLNRGFAHFEDRPTTPATILMRTAVGSALEKAVHPSRWISREHKVAARSGAEIRRAFLTWWTRRDRRRPAFAFLNFFDAHEPYLVPADVRRRFTSQPPVMDLFDGSLDRFSPADVAALNDSYDAAVAYLDAELGALFDTLEREGTLDRTIVAITADHGEQFGEHGLLDHANSLYMPLLHVPLIVLAPGAPQGARVSDFVSLRDVPSTLLDLAMPGVPGQLPGESLRPLWDHSLPSRAHGDEVLSEVDSTTLAYPDHYPARKGPMQSLVMRGRHYIRNLGSGQEELFDLSSDPAETLNLARSQPELLESYRRRLEGLAAVPLDAATRPHPVLLEAR